MDDIKEKDRFQLVCFDNNNAAFFFDTVVLVEGDSDFIVFPHIARLLSPRWDAAQALLRFARIGGKASIRRYRQFFSRFDISVIVITDLDILTKDFDQLDPNQELSADHSRLMQAIDTVIGTAANVEASSKQVKKAQESGEVQLLWRKAKQVRQDMKDGKATLDDVERAVEEFFAWEKRHKRLEVLKNSNNETVRTAKNAIIAKLRKQKVFVLEQGALEAYYPDTIEGVDKPTKVHDFCRKVTTKEDVNALCGDIDHDGYTRKEFEVLFECLVASVMANECTAPVVSADAS